ncbi:MAG: SDR family NAD(P)-dependent oxidoreductase, partial [Cycloclasticus pugetii]
GECFAVACDVRDYEQVEQMHKQVIDHFGPIDVLLNNAAGNFISLNVGEKAADIYTKLLHEAVIVRPIAGYNMPDYLRVSVGLAEENEVLLSALKKVI